MDIIKINKRIYVLLYFFVNLIIFCVGYIFILKGCSQDNNAQVNVVYISIGTSLIASGIVMFLELFREILKGQLFKRIYNIIFEGGLEFLYEKRDLDKYDSLMKNIKKKVDITGYTLNAFYESYSDLIIEKVKANPGIIIRIILVNPDSEFSKNRAKLENRKHESFKDSVERIKSSFHGYTNIKLRQIDSPLSTMIFRIDDIIFAGPHLHKKTSKSTLTMELNKKGWLFAEYEMEFERLWNDAKPLA